MTVQSSRQERTLLKRLLPLFVWVPLALVFGLKTFFDLSLYNSTVLFWPCLATGGIHWFSWAILYPLISKLSRWLHKGEKSLLLFFLVHALIGILTSFFVYLLMVIVFSFFHKWQWIPYPNYPLLILFLNCAAYIAIVGIDNALLFFGQSTQLKMRHAQLQSELADARLKTLKMQLRPHFFFNSLNTIRMLIEMDKGKAIRVTTLLGDFLRTTLNNTEVIEVPFAEELQFAKSYLEIQEIRFSKRLSIEFDICETSLDVMVPHLVIQPIIENSMLHVFSKTQKPGTLKISANCQKDVLSIRIWDSGLEKSPGKFEERIGLGNTRTRLATLYGQNASMQIFPSNGGTLVNISIPMESTT